MYGTALVTVEEVVCLYAPGSETTVERLDAWTAARDLKFTANPVGSSVDPETDALGVSLGGDGTFLESIRLLAPHGVPVTGINHGTLSFLARIPPTDATTALAEIVHGDATVLDRLQLEITGAGLKSTAINDVTFEPPHSNQSRTTCRLEVFVDEEYVGTYDGGGLTVSTPTGSTAMGLSARGPVHLPRDNETIQLAALHHDGLGNRALVFDADRTVSVIPDRTVTASVDGGRAVTTISPGTRLTLTGAEQPAHIVRTSFESSFFAALAEKLGWHIRRTDPETLPEPPGWREGYQSSDSDSIPTSCDQSGSTHDERPPWLVRRRQRRAQTDEPTLSPGEHGHLERTGQLARDVAQSAGAVLRRFADRVDSTQDPQERHRLATRAEEQSEQILTVALKRTTPEHTINVSGKTVHRGRREGTWFVDAIDGWSNFEHGNPSYCVTLAFVREGVPEVGVVYAPETGELFHAIEGYGAYRNDAQIEPTDRQRLDVSMLLSGYDPDGEFLKTFYPHTRGVRRIGSQALNLCYVAAGSADALWEYDTYPWDVAAGLCILHEAGGRATGPQGEPFELSADEDVRSPLLVSNGPLHPELVALVSGNSTD